MQVIIKINDANDNPPRFTEDIYYGSAVESDPPGTNIVTVTATDLDEGDNSAIFYVITNGNGRGMYASFISVK